MKFGMQLPTASEGYAYPVPFANHTDILELAKEAEGLGYSTIWANDRLIVPENMVANRDIIPNFYEVLLSLAFVASVTKHVRLGTGVLQLPVRDPVLLAKQVATLDVFSNGRVILGVGVGANRDEFRNLNPQWAGHDRGEIADESLEAISLLWRDNSVSFQGNHFQFRDATLSPKPSQKPLPIYISGRTPNTFRRIAQWGTGWIIPVAWSPAAISEGTEKLERLLENKNRSLTAIRKVAVAILCLGKTHEEASGRFLRTRLVERVEGRNVEEFTSNTLIGTVDEVIDRVGKLEEAGVEEIFISKATVNSFEEYRAQFRWFGEEVLPHFKKD